ncbi:hypothetical protein KGA66_23140 [Actinocrinis puniceicyclus]|uniref:HTH luxR-type domain-containing protein n=1 Tax=Actinocrinis puniceicyclus TaxID=977794 RepID=A0A8J7WSI4_9ACTN|nr:hypothetical protein [Actinocrinis puniceicyclus]MBS2965960.1 hypothetical protein [Actinocrinis puniceicyclus]
MTEVDVRVRPPQAGPVPEAGWPTLPRAVARREERPAHISELPTELLAAEIEELTRRELSLLAPGPVPGGLDGAVPPEVLAAMARRRVDVRVLYVPTGLPQRPAFDGLVRDGVALEAVQELPHFVAVRDRSVVYLPYQGPHIPASGWATRVRSTVLAGSLAAAFEAMWALAARRAAELPGEGCRDEVLEVLSAGLTDDRAAIRLHMSKRTFARRVATLMADLDASSRFQAGVRAARRGWV